MIISWVICLKYLGMFFNAEHKLECNIDYSVRKFYTAANTIYSRSKFCSEISKLFLMETFCLPLISYGCECVNHDGKNFVN